MIHLLQKTWRWLPWFIAGLLSTVLFVMSSGQPTMATTSSNNSQTTTLQQFGVDADVTSYSNPAFEQVAASHLEPNFY